MRCGQPQSKAEVGLYPHSTDAYLWGGATWHLAANGCHFELLQSSSASDLPRDANGMYAFCIDFKTHTVLAGMFRAMLRFRFERNNNKKATSKGGRKYRRHEFVLHCVAFFSLFHQIYVYFISQLAKELTTFGNDYNSAVLVKYCMTTDYCPRRVACSLLVSSVWQEKAHILLHGVKRHVSNETSTWFCFCQLKTRWGDEGLWMQSKIAELEFRNKDHHCRDRLLVCLTWCLVPVSYLCLMPSDEGKIKETHRASVNLYNTQVWVEFIYLTSSGSMGNLRNENPIEG